MLKMHGDAFRALSSVSCSCNFPFTVDTMMQRGVCVYLRSQHKLQVVRTIVYHQELISNERTKKNICN